MFFKDAVNSQLDCQIETSKEEYPDDLNPFGDDEDEIITPPNGSANNPGFKTSSVNRRRLQSFNHSCEHCRCSIDGIALFLVNGD